MKTKRNPYIGMMNGRAPVATDEDPRGRIHDVVDQLATHQQTFARLAYRDPATAAAITRMVDDLARRYEDIDGRINAGHSHDEPGLAADERALAWDVRAIQKWNCGGPG